MAQRSGLRPRMGNVKGPSLGRPLSDDGGRTGFGRDRGGSSRLVVGLMVAASLIVITVDAASGEDSPVDPAARRGRQRHRPGRGRHRDSRAPLPRDPGLLQLQRRPARRRGPALRPELPAPLRGRAGAARPQPARRARRADQHRQPDRLRPGRRPRGRDGPDAVLLAHGDHRRRHVLGHPPGHDRAQQRRPGRPGDQRDPHHRQRAARRRHRLRRRRRGSAPTSRSASCADAGSPATAVASTSTSSTTRSRRPRATSWSPGGARTACPTSPASRSARSSRCTPPRASWPSTP